MTDSNYHEHAILPVKIFSDSSTCKYEIWDPKTESYLIKNHRHHWQWVSVDGKLTNIRRCGTCGFRDTVPEYRTESKIPYSHSPAYHATRTEQQP